MPATTAPVKDLEEWELREIFHGMSKYYQKLVMQIAHMREMAVEALIYSSICSTQGESVETLPNELLAEMRKSMSDGCVPRFSRVH